MKAKLIVRIAAACIFVHLLGHGVGHATWKSPEDLHLQEVVKAMIQHKAPFMGAERSMADYYDGFSLILFGVYAMSIAILWSVSGFVNTHGNIASKILWPLGLVYTGFGIIEFLYFFPFAAAMSFLAGVLILVAIWLKNENLHS